MAIFKDTIMIRAGSVDRAVEVVIDAPEGTRWRINGFDVK